jgi:hypothetical protein
MKYMLLIYGDEARWGTSTAEEREAGFQLYTDYSKWLVDQGWFSAGDALQSTDQATTVRVKDGKTLTTDGPFAETKEQLGGYYIVECDNLDQAIEAAAKCPGAQHGSMEVRPLMDM